MTDSYSSGSAGYYTDYSTLEASRRQYGRHSSVCPVRPALPGRSSCGGSGSFNTYESLPNPEGSCNTYPRRARSSVINDECQELLGPSSSRALAQNSGRRNLVAMGGNDDVRDVNDEGDEEEDMVRDDPRYCPPIINCSLIPACVIRQWLACRVCYILWFCILLTAIAMIAGVSIFWGIQLFKYRSHISETVDMATSGSYDVTPEFPMSNIYGSNVCLRFDQSASDNDISKLAYVSMFSEKCNDTTLTIHNESLYRNSPLQYNIFMFQWLQGTTVSIHIKVNGAPPVAIYLLNDRVSEHYCSMHQTPLNVVMKWMFDFTNCNLNVNGGYMDCHLQTTINSSGTYYICINSTISVGLSYEINISSVVYDTSGNKMSLDCTQAEDCCLPFDSLISEALHPTCMYITTQALSPDYLGMKLVDVNIQVGQRLSVIKYCLILLLVLLFLIGVIVIFFLLTRYKAEHPDFNPRGCTVHCSMYGRSEKHFTDF